MIIIKGEIKMFEMNYFQVICFLWAILGIGSRLAMLVMGERWAKWELDSAYTEVKPKWLYPVGGVGYLIVAYTWYQVFALDIKYSWIIAALISLTTIKLTTLLFNYKAFYSFVVRALKDKKKMFQINSAVIILSCVLALMGIYE